MAKTSIKVKCDSVISNQNNSQARFAIPAPPAPPAKPGEPPVRLAKTIVTLQYSTADEATVFKVGKDYTITIEG